MQVGWLGGTIPVFLDAVTRDDGLLVLYAATSTKNPPLPNGRGGPEHSDPEIALLSIAFPMPPKPVDFGALLLPEAR